MRSLPSALWIGLVGGCVCCPPRGSDPTPMPAVSIPFTHVAHAIVVPVRVDDAIDACFVLDTGIGLELVSKSLSDRLGRRTSGEVKGKRMSGQELTVPTTRLDALAVGDRRDTDPRVGVWDMSALPPAFAGIDGFVSLAFFERRPFTLDYGRKELVLESDAGLAARAAAGVSLPLKIDRTPDTLGVFLEMDVGAGRPALLEVDTGSDSLILDTRYLKALGIDPAGADVKTVEGTDETGHSFVRRFTRLRTPIFPPAAPAMRLENPAAMFQDVVYDGLVGHAYFKNFVVTYDLPNARMILREP